MPFHIFTDRRIKHEQLFQTHQIFRVFLDGCLEIGDLLGIHRAGGLIKPASSLLLGCLLREFRILPQWGGRLRLLAAGEDNEDRGRAADGHNGLAGSRDLAEQVAAQDVVDSAAEQAVTMDADTLLGESAAAPAHGFRHVELDFGVSAGRVDRTHGGIIAGEFGGGGQLPLQPLGERMNQKMQRFRCASMPMSGSRRRTWANSCARTALSFSAGHCRHATGGMTCGKKIPTVNEAATNPDSCTGVALGRNAGLIAASRVIPAFVRAIRATDRQPGSRRETSARTPMPYTASATPGHIGPCAGEAAAAGASGTIGASAGAITSRRSMAPACGVVAGISGGATTPLAAAGTGIEMDGTQDGRTGMSSIAHKTALQAAWSTPLERTRTVIRMSATMTATIAIQKDESGPRR